MSTPSPVPEMRELDWLAPVTREILQEAAHEAQLASSSTINPEHLLLGILAQDESQAAILLRKSTLDTTTISQHTYETGSSSSAFNHSMEFSPPLAVATQECIDRAIALVTYYLAHHQKTVLVTPEYLLLSILYHPQMQPLFATISSNIIALRARLLEGMETDFIRYMEELFLFPERIKDGGRNIISFVSFDQERSRRVLKSVEFPTMTLQEVAQQNQAKQAVKKTIAFLRDPEKTLDAPRGLLFTGTHNANQTTLIRAVAGEAEVPFIIVYCSVLLEMLLHPEQAAASTKDTDEEAQHIIREIFHPIQMFSHCMVFLDTLDELVEDQGLSHSSERALLTRLLVLEIDKLLSQQGVVVSAFSSARQNLNGDLLLSHRLAHTVLLEKPVRQIEKEQTDLMPVLPIDASLRCIHCHRVVQMRWKHCVYCGTSLQKKCSHCGAPYPELQGAHYCSECGSLLS